MKRILLFILLVSFVVGCTVDKGEGTFTVDAEVTNMGNTIISIKYFIGETVIFDDISMKKSIGLLQMFREKKLKSVPLKIHIEFHTQDDGNNSSSLKYYYGANLLGESQSFDTDAIILIANANEKMFMWEYKDGHVRNDKKKPEEKEDTKKMVPIDDIKEDSGKL